MKNKEQVWPKAGVVVRSCVLGMGFWTLSCGVGVHVASISCWASLPDPPLMDFEIYLASLAKDALLSTFSFNSFRSHQVSQPYIFLSPLTCKTLICCKAFSQIPAPQKAQGDSVCQGWSCSGWCLEVNSVFRDALLVLPITLTGEEWIGIW